MRDRLAVAALLVALGLAAQASASPSLFWWFGAAFAIFGTAWLLIPAAAPAMLNPLSAVIFGYSAWLVVANLLLHPYNAAASYDAAFLAGGFLVGHRAGRERTGPVFVTLLAFALALAIWALAQVALDGGRSRALFETPSTLGAVLNVPLVAGAVLVAAGTRDARVLACLAVIAGALLGTQSRGAMLAFAAAAVLAFLLARRSTTTNRNWAAIGALAGVGLCVVLALTWRTAAESGATRLDLYGAALRASRDSPITGSGYLTFRHVLQAAAPSIPGYLGATTDFVHEDYLQAFLESGLPGAVLLALMALMPPWMAWRRRTHLREEDRMPVVALVAAMSAMAVQALVDFPFHIAICLALYGGCAAQLSARLADRTPAAPAGRLREVVRATVAGGVLLLLVKPVAAEAAALYARAQWEEGRIERAGYWFDLARRLEAADWRYSTYAGEFWFAQAQHSGHAGAARLADRLFQEGEAADPREVSPLLWRISTHLYLRALLPQPADAATLRAWVERATAMAPLDQRVQLHRRLVARFEAQGARR